MTVSKLLTNAITFFNQGCPLKMTTREEKISNFCDAYHYNENSSVQESESNYLIKNSGMSFFKKNILDVGCGDGKISKTMNNMGANVTGIDASPNMIKFAKKHQNNCSFYQEDARELNQHNNYYDIITSFNCLHWISEIEKALAGVKSCLLPKGTFIGLIYPRCSELWEAAEWCEQLPKYSTNSNSFENPYVFHTKDGFYKLLSDANFINIRIWLEDKETKFPSIDNFKDYITGWLPHCAYYGKDFINDWFEKYIDLTNQSAKNEITMAYKTMFFIAS